MLFAPASELLTAVSMLLTPILKVFIKKCLFFVFLPLSINLDGNLQVSFHQPMTNCRFPENNRARITFHPARQRQPLNLVVRHHLMRSYFLIFVLCVGGISLARCQEHKSARFVIRADEVMPNSIRIAPNTTTDVHVNFKFEGKSPEEIKELVGRNSMKPVFIEGVDSTRTQGVVKGILAEHNIPVGIVVSFETRADAEKAKQSLRVRNKP